MDNIVKLVFQSAVAGSGFDDFLRQTEASIAKTGELGQAMTVVSSKLGTFGSAIGGVVGNLVKGSLWGAATAAIMGVVEAVKKWRAEAALAAEANARAFAEVQQKAAAAEQMNSAYRKSNELIDAAAKRKLEDIALTNRQTKAELELAAAKAKAAGKESEAAALAAKAKAADTGAQRESAKVTVEAAREKLDAAKKQASALPGWEKGEFKFDPKEWERQRRLRNGRINRLTEEVSTAEIANAYHYDKGGLSPDDLELKKKELEMETRAREKFIGQMKLAKQAAENIADAERTLTNARREARAAVVENQKTVVIAKQEAARASREESLRKLTDAKAASETRAPSLASEASRWQGEFDAAFDLWRDPEAAAAAVDADRKRGEDMKAFRKAVSRYGGKGKIDEYARLMREGDEEGMQERLAQWRKSSKFTPQAEQLVKAAAAEQNRNTAEKNLEEIKNNTAQLAKKIDDLLSVK